MIDTTPEDRSVSPIAAGGFALLKSKRMRWLTWGVSGLALTGFLFMGARSVMNDPGVATKPEDTGSASISQAVQGPPVPAVEPPAPITPPVFEIPDVRYARPAPQLVFVDPPKPALPAASTAPAVVAAVAPDESVRFPASGGEEFFDTAAPTSPVQDKGAQGTAARGMADVASTNVNFQPHDITGGKAGKAIRMTYVMRPQSIPCALAYSMDSTLAGSIMCHTTVDVFSQDHVLLMPAGTEIDGSYKANVATGQQRLFAFAGYALTTEGIPVPLDSGIGDGLGRSGIPGDVDNHTGERLGAALLLTGFGAATGILQSEVSKQGQTSLNLDSGSGVGGISSQILQHQINIPPTITVPAGTLVSIIVDHPISFEDALKVTTKE